MSQIFYTQGIEEATVTITNGGSNSDAALLKRRDHRVKGLDVSAGTSTVQVEIDYGTATDVDYVVVGNITTTATVLLTLYYWDGSSWINNGFSNITAASGVNEYRHYVSPNATKYRVDFTRNTSTILQVSTILIGERYSTPFNYFQTENPGSYFKNEVDRDGAGYPFNHALDTAKKQMWDITYGLTDTQRTSFENSLADVKYNAMPFYMLDEQRSDNVYLVWKSDGAALRSRRRAAEYCDVSLRLEEL